MSDSKGVEGLLEGLPEGYKYDVAALMLHATNMFAKASECLQALTRKLTAEVEAAECQAKLARHQVEEEEARKQKEQEPKGMMKAPYGFCPKCRSEGVHRTRKGIDTCARGHVYESKRAVSMSKVFCKGDKG